jgi:hypothetical protein
MNQGEKSGSQNPDGSRKEGKSDPGIHFFSLVIDLYYFENISK